MMFCGKQAAVTGVWSHIGSSAAEGGRAPCRGSPALAEDECLRQRVGSRADGSPGMETLGWEKTQA